MMCNDCLLLLPTTVVAGMLCFHKGVSFVIHSVHRGEGVVQSQLVQGQHTGNIKCIMG